MAQENMERNIGGSLRSEPILFTRRYPVTTDAWLAAINTSHLSFSFQPIHQVFAHTVVVFAFDGFGPFACLQSRVHYIWAKLLSSSLKDDMRYSVSDAFQTFAFPSQLETAEELESGGKECYGIPRFAHDRGVARV